MTGGGPQLRKGRRFADFLLRESGLGAVEYGMGMCIDYRAERAAATFRQRQDDHRNTPRLPGPTRLEIARLRAGVQIRGSTTKSAFASDAVGWLGPASVSFASYFFCVCRVIRRSGGAMRRARFDEVSTCPRTTGGTNCYTGATATNPAVTPVRLR